MVVVDMAQNLIFDSIANLARALGHPNRVLLLELIVQGERSVERLSELSKLSIANASQHLQALKRAGLVIRRQDGKHAIYGLADESVVRLLHAFRSFLVARGDTRGDAHNVGTEVISCDELVRRLKSRSVVLLDVRPEDEFAFGRLPGAVNIPIDQLSKRLKELPRGKEIIAYCRGPYCVLSQQARSALLAKGWNSRQFAEGYSGWRMNGLPIEALH